MNTLSKPSRDQTGTKWKHFRSSCQEVFYKQVVLRNFVKFTGKHLFQSLFLNKVAGPQNGQTHSNNSSATALFFSVLYIRQLKYFFFIPCLNELPKFKFLTFRSTEFQAVSLRKRCFQIIGQRKSFFHRCIWFASLIRMRI